MADCPAEIDTTNMGCVDVLRQMFDVYMGLLAGSTARIRMGTRWSEYHPGNAPQLKMLYMQIYQQCQDPAKCTLPDLSQSTIQRGPPVGGRFPAPYGPVAGRRWPGCY